MDWSRTEVALVVLDYMSMLSDELRGVSFNKSKRCRKLLPLLNNRSKGSVEFKRQNISAVLIGLGFPYIIGYKPRGNFQALLVDGISDYLVSNDGFSRHVELAVAKPAKTPPVSDYLGCLESPPGKKGMDYSKVGDNGGRPRLPIKTNFLELEARNASLGLAGEKFVVRFEKERLLRSGERQRARRVEHVSVTEGDGLGYDIRSFDSVGKDRLIEVKTTAGGKQTPFFVSRNELQVSQEYRQSYHLYRVFCFRQDKGPRLFTVSGALSEVCTLEATQYSARAG